MHLSKKSKRKASVVSNEHNDQEVLPPAQTKEDKKRLKRAKKEAKTQRKATRNKTPDDPHPQPSSPSEEMSSPRADSVAESLTLQPTTSSTQTSPTSPSDPNQPTPRRSSRIKESMNSLSRTWSKARPYIERINGTIMPLEPQAGTKAYYARDGVRVD